MLPAVPCRYSFLAALTVLLSLAASRWAPADEKDDERLLRESRVETTGEGLLTFLRARSLSEASQKEMAGLVRRLGHESFEEREKATRRLVAHGRLSLPFLRAALTDADAEVARRAAECLEQIEEGPDLALRGAVLRLLRDRHPEGAVPVLLDFVPCEEDEAVREEALHTLAALGLPGGKAHPGLVEALGASAPARRGAAGFVVGRAADPRLRERVLPLLRDRDLGVRFLAIEGLLAGREKRAVPPLIDLLASGPPALAWRAESLLLRLARTDAPLVSAGTGSAEERARWRDAWAGWWEKQGGRIDLDRLGEGESYLGLMLVAEMHGDRIWEVGLDGKVRWQMEGLAMPRDAQVLSGGRVLVAEVRSNTVTERDLSGKVLWSYPFQDPAYVLRLPNGNTFLGNHGKAVEITREGREVFSYQPNPSFLIHSMFRRPNGSLVCLSMGGLLLEVDRSGKEVRRFQLDTNNRNWCGVEGLPGNRYLVVDLIQGEVIEVDASGNRLWGCVVPGASYALRLPSGRTMVCSFNERRVVHVDRGGKVVWEHKAATSPWRARFR